MEVELQARKRDSARVVESVKTQAIFNVRPQHSHWS